MAIESGRFQDVSPIKNQIVHCYVSLLACNIFFILLMEEIGHLDVKNPENSGINYQPQLVIAGFLKHQHYESRMVQTIQPSENAAQALVGLDDRLAELFPRNGPGTQGNESHGSTTHPYLSLDLEFRSVCNIVFIYIYIYICILWSYTDIHTIRRCMLHITSLYMFSVWVIRFAQLSCFVKWWETISKPMNHRFLRRKKMAHMAPSHDTPGPYIENAVRDEFPEGLLATQIYATLGSTDSSTEHPVRILQKYRNPLTSDRSSMIIWHVHLNSCLNST